VGSSEWMTRRGGKTPRAEDSLREVGFLG